MRVLAVLALLALTSPASCRGFRFVPAASVGAYHPASTRASTELLTGVQVRAIDQVRPGQRVQRLEYGLSASRWTSPFESIDLLEVEALAFYGPGPVLLFDHEPFFGVGLGRSTVERDGAVLARKPLATFSGGLAVPAGDWDIEARVKLIVGTHNETFDVSGTAVSLAASTALELWD